MGAFELALAGEADAGEHLRRATVAAPEAAILAVELVVVFAGFGLPGADAAFGAAHFDDVGKFGHAGDAPVEAVAAEIGEFAPGVGVVLQRVQRAERVIFGVRAGEHGAVGREQSGALVVEVFIGDDVEGDAFGFEPGEQMRVGGVVPQAGAERIVEGKEARAHGEDGAPARGDADAAVVGVAVISGAAVDGVVVGVVGRGAPGGGTRLVGGVGIAAGVVGVGLVGKGRGQE